jgi:hypothetical protein
VGLAILLNVAIFKIENAFLSNHHRQEQQQVFIVFTPL